MLQQLLLFAFQVPTKAFVCLISCFPSTVNTLAHVGTVGYMHHTFTEQAKPKLLVIKLKVVSYKIENI